MITDSPKQTQKIAELLVKTLIKTENHPTIFCLQGNLGAGKTTFIQGVAKALKIKEKITSPTFVLMKKFPLSKKLPFSELYHFDCYRFDKPEEILVLGFKEIIKNTENLIFIEWPEKIKKLIPKNAIWINFKVIGKNKREIIIKK
jgi:tRNA threonylcarbamoyladenosine biosynthesis protein TsaE